MRIALISLDQAWENKEKNIERCSILAHKARDHGADLVIFPEMTLTGFSMNISNTAEDRKNSTSVEFFRELALNFGIAVLFGVVFLDAGKATNDAIFIDKEGNLIGQYSKIHPFSYAGEDKFFNGGSQISSVNLGAITMGLTICYDLRFPEIYTALRECSVIVNIANWPAKRIAHWNVLLRARAIENQVFIVGVNRIGIDSKGLEYLKSTQVVTPNGDKLISEKIEPELDIFKIEPNYVNEYRGSFPTIQDRKPAIYKNFL